MSQCNSHCYRLYNTSQTLLRKHQINYTRNLKINYTQHFVGILIHNRILNCYKESYSNDKILQFMYNKLYSLALYIDKKHMAIHL